MIWLFACAQDAPRSVPTEPTVSFRSDEPAQKVVWTDLQDLLPATPAALPPSLAELAPGLNGGRAREVLDAAHEPGARIFGDTEQGQTVLASILKGRPTVGASIVLSEDATSLVEVDLTLPRDVAIGLVTDRWGKPDAVEHLDGAREAYRWRPAGSAWWAELQPNPFGEVAPGIPRVGPDKALLRFVQPSSAPGPAPASH